MELSEIIPHIEALIFASEKPLPAMDIVELINTAFGFMEERITLDQVESCVDGIREKYQSEFYPFELRQSGGGWQFLTKKEYHKTIAQLNGDKFLKRLSTAAMETLAIIAYKQPVTKGEIEGIRGVNSDYSIQKLLEKELIVISGRNENMPGKPLVYITSKTFMDYFGINSPADLPKIKEIFADQIVQPTVMNGEGMETNEEEVTGEDTPLAVSADGDLVPVVFEAHREEDAPAEEETAGENEAGPDEQQDGNINDEARRKEDEPPAGEDAEQ